MESRIEHKDSFIKTYNNWTKGNNFPLIEEDFLPNHVIVVNKAGEDICAMFLFLTSNSKTTMTAFPMTNPFVKNKYGALDFMYEELESYLKGLGYNYIYTTSDTKQIERSLKQAEYVEGDKLVTQYIKGIWGQEQ